VPALSGDIKRPRASLGTPEIDVVVLIVIVVLAGWMVPSSPDYMQEMALTIPFVVVKLLACRLDSPGRQSKNAECMKT
jgi:hypothetical protein